MPTSKIGLHDLDPSLFETLSNISSSNNQTKIFPLQVVASEDNQTIFPIGLDTFDAEKDFAFVQSGITNLFYGADFTIENKNIILNEGVPTGRTLGIYVLKNVEQTDEEDYVSGANLAPDSVTPDKIGGVLPIEKGGTGAATAEEALANLGVLSACGYITNNSNVDIIADGLYLYNGWAASTITCSVGLPFTNKYGIWIKKTPYNEQTSAVRSDVVINCETGEVYAMYGYNGIWREAYLSLTGGTLRNTLFTHSDFQLMEEGADWSTDAWNSINRIGNAGLHIKVRNAGKDRIFFLANNNVPLNEALTLWYYDDGTERHAKIFGEHNTELLAPVIQNLLTGGEISMVKSIQRGTLNVTGTDNGRNTYTINIDTINPDKAVVHLTGLVGCGSTSGNINGSMYHFLSAVQANSFTIEVGNDKMTSVLSWQVVEYY